MSNASKITECQVDSSLLVFTQSSAFLYLINLFNEVRAMLILKKKVILPCFSTVHVYKNQPWENEAESKNHVCLP